MIRALCLLLVLGALGYHLEREQSAGRFQQADDAFLDFLLANSRDRFSNSEGKVSDKVVFVRFREEDQNEYATWPPAPIDWQILLKALLPFEPDVLVIPTVLDWGVPPPEFVPQVGEALLPFPSVVLGVEGREVSAQETSATDAAVNDSFPTLTRFSGDPITSPVQRVVSAPADSIRRQMELGMVPGPLGIQAASTPFVLKMHDKTIPSLAMQALTRHTRTPYSLQRVRLGDGAGAHLGKGRYLPLTPDGSFALQSKSSVASINALDLMTGELADALSAEDRAELGRGKIVVLGIDTDQPQPTVARIQAQVLGEALALPTLVTLGEIARWSVAGAAALVGLFLLRFRGGKALRTGLLLIFAALVISFVLFQSQLIWFPPTVPGALLAASALFSMLFGRRPLNVQTADAP